MTAVDVASVDTDAVLSSAAKDWPLAHNEKKAQKMVNSNALDWPLTHNEKKTQIFRLYNYDLRAADTEVERLRAAVESAAAVLRAIKPSQGPDDEEQESADEGFTPPRPPARARSEGAEPKNVQPCKPALCRTPRSDRPTGRKKVSFGGQPEEEPVHPIMTDSDEEPEAGKRNKGTKKRRDSVQVYKERRGAAANSLDTSDDEEMKPPVKSLPSQAAPVVEAAAGRPAIKAYLPWAVCSIALAALLKDKFVSSEPSPVRQPARDPNGVITFGDPSCWTAGFRPEHCCLGDGGNPDCWDSSHTYERCCLGRHLR